MKSNEENHRENIKNKIGSRYLDADISRINFSEENKIKINDFIENPKNFLILLSCVGSGKTYFCASLLDAFNKKINDFEVKYCKEKELSSFYSIASMDEKQINFTRSFDVLKNDLIVIDDFGCKIEGCFKEIIIDFIECRYNNCLPTVITTSLSKDQIKEFYGENIFNRLMASENKIISIENAIDLRTLGY